MSRFSSFVYSQDSLKGETVVRKVAKEKGKLSTRRFCFQAPKAIYPKIPEIKKIEKLKTIWDNWTVERQNAFTTKYDDIALLLPVEVDEQLLKAIILFWDPSYRCFTFNREDLIPTMEEYVALLKISHQIRIRFF